MKQLIQIFKITKGFRKELFLAVLCNNTGVIFSLVSLTLVIPLLKTIFMTPDQMQEVLNSPLPTFEYSNEVVLEYINRFLIEQLFAHGPTSVLVGICGILISAIFFKNFFTYLGSVFLNKMVHGTVAKVRGGLFDHISLLQLSFFSKERKGDVLSRMTNDMKEIEWAVLFSTQALFKNPFEIILFMGALFVMSFKLTSFLILFLPVSGFIISWIGKSLRKTSSDGNKTMANLLSVAEETIGGIKIIKAFNARDAIREKFHKVNQGYYKLIFKVYKKTDLASPVSELLGVIATSVVLLFGGKLVFDGELDSSLLIGYIILFSQLISPFKSLSRGIYHAHRGLSSLERVEEITNTPLTITDKPNAKPISTFEQSIAFKNVSFKYEQTYVLKDINFEIKKGQSIALVGQSGSGKSTLADLIPRFYDVEEGDLLLDGHPIKNYKIEDVRKQMGIVTQQSVLFNDSVANNIAFGIKASREDIIQAAKIANAHEFVENLEEGYDTNIGEGGNKLSGGQRQRLSIARAILKNPPIMILDEATSALDTESEKLVQEALTNLMKNRTSLVIAHRLSTIKDADEILVMHDGNIVERGKHEELLALNGYYSKLCQMQSFE